MWSGQEYPCWEHNPNNPEVKEGYPHPYIPNHQHRTIFDPPNRCPGHFKTKLSDEDVERIARRVVELMKDASELAT